MSRIIASTLATLIVACSIAGAAEQSIVAGDVSVRFDPAQGRLELRQGTRIFATAAFAEPGKASCTIEKLPADAPMGAGQMMKIGPGENRIVVRDGSPFVLIRRDGRTAPTSPGNRIVALQARLDLDPSRVKVLGTGGLSDPAKNPGNHVVSAIGDPSTRAGIVAGLVRIDAVSGVILTAVADGALTLTLRDDYGSIVPPKLDEFGGDWWAIGAFDDVRDGLEGYAEAFAQLNGVKLKPLPVGFMSWYSEKYGGALNEKAVVELAKFVKETFGEWGYGFVQIDDLWQNGQKRNGPRKDFTKVRADGPYPNGMKPVAREIRKLGLTPGLWLLPFAIDHQDPILKEQSAWVVKRPDGTPFETNWSGTSLDMTRPEARAYVASFIRQAVHDWGFGYLKLDGLHIGMATKQTYPRMQYVEDGFGDAVFFDKGMTNMQAGRLGLKTIREAAGPQTFILGCCTPQNERSLGMTLGLVDAMRVGPDAGVRWKGAVTGASSSSRLYFLNGRVWWNDPDSIAARESNPLNEVRCFASWVTLTGMLNNETDWAPSYPQERIDLLRRTMPAHQLRTVRPVDLLENDPARIWVLTYEVSGQKRQVIGLFNWGDTPWTAKVDRRSAGLDPAAEYDAFEFWSATPLPRFGDLELAVPPHSCAIIATRRAEDRPRIVSTSRHVTQGAIDLLAETWDGKSLAGRSRIVGNDPYELRIAMGGRKLKRVTVDGDGKITASQDGSWARIRIERAASGEVAWKVEVE